MNMTRMAVSLASVASLMMLSACASSGVSEQKVLDDTQKLGLMLRSVEASSSTFQAQRDKINLAAQRQRNALLDIALTQEADLARSTLTWKVAGQTERLRVLDTLRADIDALAASDEAQRTQARERALALEQTRSTVSINTGKINEAALKLAGLGEAQSHTGQLKFLLGVMKDVRDQVKEDNEAAAREQSEQAQDKQGAAR